MDCIAVAPAPRGARSVRLSRWVATVLGATGIAGCFSSQWVAVHVRTTAGRPVPAAVVSCVCEAGGNAAGATDAAGNAALEVSENGDLGVCTVTAARAGFGPAQVRVETLCSSPSRCPATELELAPEPGPEAEPEAKDER